MRRLLCALVLASATLVVPGAEGVSGAPDTADADVYVRRRMDVAGTVRWIADEATRVGAGQVVFVFDMVTFAPPPGATEFSSEYGFFHDLPRWVQALGDWPKSSGVVARATSSLAPRTVLVGSNDWANDLTNLVKRPWYELERQQELEAASRWITRLLDRTEVVAGSRSGQPRLVVLVAGHLTPERWGAATGLTAYESEWRTKLKPVGAYWDAEGVATALQRKRGRLYVVAPEARFGDFSPLVELPDVPWASRPQLPPADPSGLRDRIRRATSPRRWRLPLPGLPGMPKIPGMPEMPPPEDLPEFLFPPTTPEEGTPFPDLVTPAVDGKRFRSATPVWFERHGPAPLWTNHAPSGYGYWPYARAAAESGGRYLFYPFPDSAWLDACPTDGALLARLMPELVPLPAYRRLRGGDQALEALCRARREVIGVTPCSGGTTDGNGWHSLLSTCPLKLDSDWALRQRALDLALQGSQDGMLRLGRRALDEALPAYERALARLDEAILRHESVVEKGSHPRSVANLYLGRFWFALSAFHLKAYGIYASEIERFIPDDMVGHVDRICVTYVPAIRMSDCLDAYDGRVLSDEDEARYPVWVAGEAPGRQGNLLDIPVEDPNYRARRRADRVLMHLDPRLLREALRLIEAARAVMGRYAQTGWGWTTYYSDAFTFIFKPIKVQTGHRPTPGGSKQPPRPVTPEGPNEAPDGSAPGGPATK